MRRADSILLSPSRKARMDPMIIPPMPPTAIPSRNLRSRNIVIVDLLILLGADWKTGLGQRKRPHTSSTQPLSLHQGYLASDNRCNPLLSRPSRQEYFWLRLVQSIIETSQARHNIQRYHLRMVTIVSPTPQATIKEPHSGCDNGFSQKKLDSVKGHRRPINRRWAR
jgi:hypothetical protein